MSPAEDSDPRGKRDPRDFALWKGHKEDEPETANKYRPFVLDSAIAAEDWVSKLELATVTEMAHDDIAKTGQRLRVLVLYGSLRRRYGITL